MTLLSFLDRTITASIVRRHSQLVDALIVISKTKIFDEQVFDKFGWEEFETSLFGSGAKRETRFEIVVSFLSNIVENVPEVFHSFRPLVDSVVEATKLSQTGILHCMKNLYWYSLFYWFALKLSNFKGQLGQQWSKQTTELGCKFLIKLTVVKSL